MLQAVAAPGSLPEAQAILASRDGAIIIAGGTAVMPVLNYGTDDFTSLVSLRRAGLSGVSVKGGSVEIGAATTLSDLEDHAALAFMRPALDTVASPTIRNMATLGGNLFVKQPYGDLAACLIALNATATIAGSNGSRTETVELLVQGALGPGEIVTRLSFVLPKPGSFKFRKATRRAQNSAAIVTVAAVVETAGGKVSSCRIALGGVASHAVRARSVEQALAGKPLDRASVDAAASQASKDISPSDDAYASAWYRARVTPVHIRRALLGE
jgi:CO/xanthine dehydrogenase FAD-binding subunit